MDWFNFPALPSVVQELITKEIITNFTPENWIQFAQSSKSCNELVKNAKPKKIIKDFSFQAWTNGKIHFTVRSRYYVKTPEEMMKILENCQIESFQLYALSIFKEKKQLSHPNFSNILLEALKFCKTFRNRIVKETDSNGHWNSHGDSHRDPAHLERVALRENARQIVAAKFEEFYKKLEHVIDCLVIDSSYCLNTYSHFPPNVVVKPQPTSEENKLDIRFFKNLADKTKTCPLKSLLIENVIPVNEFQHFLKISNFMDGAEISFRTQTSEDKTVEVLLKYLGNNTFEVETYPYPSAKIKIDTRLDARKRQILKLSTTFSVMQEIEFCVTSSSNRTHPSFIGFLEETDQEFVIEGARPSDWLKVRIYPPNSQYVILHYTQQMLDKHFPRQSYPTDLERITKINNILGCQIKLTQAADLHKVI